MECRIVEGIAFHHDAFIVTLAVTVARSVVVCPRNGTPELLHLTRIGNHFMVGHAIIIVCQKARLLIIGTAEIIGRADTVEAIDHKHRLGSGR